jgi:hypothetical protein
LFRLESIGDDKLSRAAQLHLIGWLELRRELLATLVVIAAGENSDFVVKDLIDETVLTVDAP